MGAVEVMVAQFSRFATTNLQSQIVNLRSAIISYSPIHIFSLTDLKDDNDKFPTRDAVKNAILAGAYAKDVVVTGEFS